MKKQRFLFALFMAIVMMAMSPGKAWGQDEECEHEYNYVQLLGGGSHYQKCDKCNGNTDTEYCTFVDGICMYCEFECQHPEYTMEEDSHTCISCGFFESHEWNEGKCDICHRECLHPQVEQDAFDSHKCSTCGASADHEWDDMGHCFICDYVCQHEDNEDESTWNDGVCSNCGYKCQHEDISIVEISAPDIDYDDYVRYYENDEVIQDIEFEIECKTCGKHLTQGDSNIARVTETYITDDNKPTCTEEGGYNFNAEISVYNSDGLQISSIQINEVFGNIIPLGHSFSEEMNLCDDGYHYPVCEREGCDALSEDKYAKMFGEYKLVTGDENPTATIQMTKVGNWYYTSLYTDFPYYLSWIDDNDNTSTYTVSSAADGVVTLGDINDVPANCGVIIIKYADESSVAECTIEYAPYIYSYDETGASPLLTGSETDVSPAANQYAFGLSDTGYLGFWHWAGMTIPAWSAYLDLGSETVNEAKGFRMVFEDGTTAIEQVPAKASIAEGRYDLMGRKVNKVKGLGIVDGKKVYVPRK